MIIVIVIREFVCLLFVKNKKVDSDEGPFFFLFETKSETECYSKQGPHTKRTGTFPNKNKVPYSKGIKHE